MDSNNPNTGRVRVFKYNDSTSSPGEWRQIGENIDGEDAYDHSGYSISLSGDGMTVVIGAAKNDGNGGQAGHVRVMYYN